MRKLILLFIISGIFSTQGKSQGSKPVAISDSATWQKPEKIYTKVEVESSFPGGDNAWRTFLQNNLNGNIATASGAPSGTYTVVIRFVVDRSGALRNFTSETHLGFGMESEAIRLLRNSSPNWVAATVGGRKVSSYRRQPITFVVP